MGVERRKTTKSMVACQHRLRDAQEKTSTVLSATKYEGISGYVTQVKNNLIFKNKKSETTNCEHDETECCAHPEQGSEATRFLGEKKECVQDTSRSGSIQEPSDLLDRSSISDKGASSCESASKEHVAEEMELHFIQALL